MEPPSKSAAATSTPSAPSSSTSTPRPPPLIPLTVLDAPSQRLWAVSIVGAVQAYKLYTIFSAGPSLSLALLLDLSIILSLSKLRIPRLDFHDAIWASIGLAAALTDWMILGGWDTVLPFLGLGGLTSWVSSIWQDTFSRPMGLSEHRVRISNLVRPSNYLLGQHTIHILPYSTATFASSAPSCHCIGTARSEIKIPVFFNNTEPHALQYSVTPFGVGAQPVFFNVSIPKSSLVTLSDGADAGIDVFDDAEWDEVQAEVSGSSALVRRHRDSGRSGQVAVRGKEGRLQLKRPKTFGQQKTFDLVVKSAGRVRLERVLDKSGMDARIARGQIMIVGCPTATFASLSQQAGTSKSTVVAERPRGQPRVDATEHVCPGDQGDFKIAVQGLAPLEVTYRQTWQPSSLSPRSKPEVQTLSIGHISDSKIASPLVGTDASGVEDILSVALDRRRSSQINSVHKSFDWAIAQRETVSIPVTYDQPGSYTFELDKVRDACGNEVGADVLKKNQGIQRNGKLLSGVDTKAHNILGPHIGKKHVQAHSRAHVSIIGCSAQNPIRLLRDGPAKEIVLKANRFERDTHWTAEVRFEPEDATTAAGWTKNVTFSKEGIARLEAEVAGNYILDQVEGTYCSGEVGSPWSCPAIQVPPPTADITFSEIEDVCAGSVGVKALAVFNGSPPFRLQYEIKRAGRNPIHQERTIDRTREEFEFRPATEGAVQYRFLSLSDSNYRQIALDGPVFEQVVHPLASAKFVGSDSAREAAKTMVMRSCERRQASAEIELSGKGPFDLTYSVRTSLSSGSHSEGKYGAGEVHKKTLRQISGPRYTLDLELPPEIDAHGGHLTVSLTSIKDAKNCERALTTSDINIEVRRTQPTAAFIIPSSHQHRSRNSTAHSEVLEGQDVRLPVRLEGEGPWKVEYIREGDSLPVTTTLRSAESELVVDRAGSYSLVSVSDAFCPGKVLSASSQWSVTVHTRPSVQFDASAGSFAAKNGSLLRPALCRGSSDAATVLTSGRFPVQVTYEHWAPSWGTSAEEQKDSQLYVTDGSDGRSGRRRRESFATAQNTTALHLSTQASGWHRYQLVEVGDANYASSPLSAGRQQKGSVYMERRMLEQFVHPLPTALFLDQDPSIGRRSGAKKKSFCLGDSLKSTAAKDVESAAPTVQLTGTPPFMLEFELASSTNAQGSSRRFVRSNIQSHTFTLGLEGASSDSEEPFRFDSTGKWTYRILSLVDGNGCASFNAPTGQNEQLNSNLGGAGRASADIEVAETASIAPVGTRNEFCVGESIEYVLQGTPPWTVHYTFNGKESSASNMRTALFSRVAEREGVLEIKSVAHQTNTCRRMIDADKEAGMRKTVHPLPRAKIMEGGSTIQDLREGATADIVFHLEGTPPFSLTYQHLEPEDYFTKPKILSEATVAGIMDHEYRVTAHDEGTWRIVWLQDRNCQSSAPARAS